MSRQLSKREKVSLFHKNKVHNDVYLSVLNEKGVLSHLDTYKGNQVELYQLINNSFDQYSENVSMEFEYLGLSIVKAINEQLGEGHIKALGVSQKDKYIIFMKTEKYYICFVKLIGINNVINSCVEYKSNGYLDFYKIKLKNESLRLIEKVDMDEDKYIYDKLSAYNYELKKLNELKKRFNESFMKLGVISNEIDNIDNNSNKLLSNDKKDDNLSLKELENTESKIEEEYENSKFLDEKIENKIKLKNEDNNPIQFKQGFMSLVFPKYNIDKGQKGLLVNSLKRETLVKQLKTQKIQSEKGESIYEYMISMLEELGMVNSVFETRE